MTINGWLQIAIFLALILAVTKPLGVFMTRVFNRERTFLDPVLRPVERLVYRLTGVDENHEMRWTEYAFAMLLFSLVSMLLLYLIQRVQLHLPFNPQKFAGSDAGAPGVQHGRLVHHEYQLAGLFGREHDELLHPDGWSRLSQLCFRGDRHRAGDRVHSRHRAAADEDHRQLLGGHGSQPACGCCCRFALIGALLLVSQGVVQNLKPYDTAKLVEPQQVQHVNADGKPAVDANGKPVMDTVTTQTIAQGPVASQEIIKECGTNGGGFFNANSSHPFENPTPLTNYIEMFAIFAIGAGLTYTLGRMTGSQAHGWAVWGAMAMLFVAGVTVAYWAEARGNPSVARSESAGDRDCKRAATWRAKRFASASPTPRCSPRLRPMPVAAPSTAGIDSFTPLGGMVPLVNIMLSEVIFGGVGAGMYGILIYVVLAVFIAGLMVGRTPEYLGKKIEAYDVKMAMLVALVFPLVILVFTGISHRCMASAHPASAILGRMASPKCSTPIVSGLAITARRSAVSRPTRSGTTPVSASTMLMGRFFMIIPMLAIAGNLAQKKYVPPSLGTFPVTTPLFTAIADRRDHHRRRADIFPGVESGTDS